MERERQRPFHATHLSRSLRPVMLEGTRPLQTRKQTQVRGKRDRPIDMRGRSTRPIDKLSSPQQSIQQFPARGPLTVPALDIDVSGRSDFDERSAPRCGAPSSMDNRSEGVVRAGDYETRKEELLQGNRLEAPCRRGEVRTVRVRHRCQKRRLHGHR